LRAAEARYHHQCYLNFLRSRKPSNVGRPIDHRIEVAMEEIFSYIEENDDCQFTLKELVDACTVYTPNELTIKTKLKEKYGKRIFISTKSSSLTIVCFIDTVYDVNLRVWYKNKNCNEQEERLKIIESAAAIIREDIRSLIKYNSEYPPMNEIFNNLDNDVPHSLQLFLEQVILKLRKGKLESIKLKCPSISHAIVAAARPRTFMSRLQLGLSTFLHRRFGSQRILDVLSSLGVAASYSDTVKYEVSTVYHPQSFILPERRMRGVTARF